MNKTNVMVLLLLTGALMIRLVGFGKIPYGVNRDEASIGYTAYLLLHAGREEHGQSWPMRFESFGDWKQPLYIYISVPIVWLFGLSPESVRLTSLVAGIGMMVAVYFIIKKLFSPLPAMLALVMVALNPWHFHFSHLALEAMVAAALMTVGFFYLIHSKPNQNVIGVGFLWLSLFTYHASLIVVPLWFGGYVLINHSLLRHKLFILVSSLFFTTVLLIFAQAWFSPERAKVTGTTIFTMSNEALWENIYQYRTENPLTKVLHNKFIYFGKTLILHYANTFSTRFLFVQGGNHPHFNVPGYGNFQIIEIILAILGIGWIIRHNHKAGWSLIWLLLLAPIPAAITKDGIHSTREIFMIPTVQLLAAFSLQFFKKWNLLPYGLGISLIVSSLPFFHYYWGEYRIASDHLFSGYMQDVSKYIKQAQPIHSRIYLTYPYESPYIFYAFYTTLNPDVFLRTVSYYPTDTLGFRYAKSLENIHFLEDNKSLSALLPNDLERSLILSRSSLQDGLNPVATWKNLAGEPEISAWNGDELLE